MIIVLLETKNIDRESLRLQKDEDEQKYQIVKGMEKEEGGSDKFQIKGTYDDLNNAFGVYCGLLRGFLKDVG